MEAAVEQKFEYLESVLGQFIVQTNTSLGRLERNVSQLSKEMREFKDEMRVFKDEMNDFKGGMRDFKDEMRDFKDEMKDFKDEMRDFKDEMKDFKDEMKDFKGEMKDFKDEMRTFKNDTQRYIEESKADRMAMNKKWGELANKMGTVVEDIVAPSLSGVAREYFGVKDLDFFAVRLRKKRRDGKTRRVFDVIADGGGYFFVVETKATPRTEYLKSFVNFVPELLSWFPDAEGKEIVPIFASLYLPDEAVSYLTKCRVFAMAMSDENMAILNPQIRDTTL